MSPFNREINPSEISTLLKIPVQNKNLYCEKKVRQATEIRETGQSG